MIRATAFLIVILFLCVGCVSTSNLFQDGKSAGKREAVGTISASYHITPTYSSDTSGVTVDPYTIVAPWFQLQGQYGFLEWLDVGGSFGFGIYSAGFQLFTKIGLLPRENKLGIALLGLIGIAFSASSESVEVDDNVLYYNLLGALPISYDLNEKNTLVIQPMIDFENYRYTLNSDQGNQRSTWDDKSYRVGFGFIHQNKKENWVHYNLAISYSNETKQFLPTLGVAIGKR